jgi:hypothetical protein
MQYDDQRIMAWRMLDSTLCEKQAGVAPGPPQFDESFRRDERQE